MAAITGSIPEPVVVGIAASGPKPSPGPVMHAWLYIVAVVA